MSSGYCVAEAAGYCSEHYRKPTPTIVQPLLRPAVQRLLHAGDAATPLDVEKELGEELEERRFQLQLAARTLDERLQRHILLRASVSGLFVGLLQHRMQRRHGSLQQVREEGEEEQLQRVVLLLRDVPCHQLPSRLHAREEDGETVLRLREAIQLEAVELQPLQQTAGESRVQHELLAHLVRVQLDGVPAKVGSRNAGTQNGIVLSVLDGLQLLLQTLQERLLVSEVQAQRGIQQLHRKLAQQGLLLHVAHDGLQLPVERLLHLRGRHGLVGAAQVKRAVDQQLIRLQKRLE